MPSRFEKVIHIEMPRGFTLAIKEYYIDVANVLQSKSVPYEQYDSNVDFWRFLSIDLGEKSREALNSIYRSEHENSADYLAFIEALEGNREKYNGLYLEIDGITIRDKASLRGIKAINKAIELLSEDCLTIRFCQELISKYKIAGQDLISIGVDNEMGILWASVLSRNIKSSYPQTHVCLGRHHTENFSLLNRIEDLLTNGRILENFDSIIYYEEGHASTLIGLLEFLNHDRLDALNNIITINNKKIIVNKRIVQTDSDFELNSELLEGLEHYIVAMNVNPLNVHYNLNLVGNQCYYSKCTFCVQIKKHFNKRYYDEKERLDRSIEIIKFLREKVGVKYYSFIDEAIRPKELKRLCESSLFNSLDVEWNMRLIADPNLKPDLVKELFNCGCREVLFGLETIDADTALAMGKVSSKAEMQGLIDLIYLFSDNGIRLILSMIYNFPTAPTDEDEKLLGFARKVRAFNSQVDFIFNQFALFGNTPIFNDPKDFGNLEILPAGLDDDLVNTYSYIAESSDCTFDLKRSLSYQCLQLNIKSTQLKGLIDSGVFILLVNAFKTYYASWGFIYRNRFNKSLFSSISKNILAN